jgi:hypothetical protein
MTSPYPQFNALQVPRSPFLAQPSISGRVSGLLLGGKFVKGQSHELGVEILAIANIWSAVLQKQFLYGALLAKVSYLRSHNMGAMTALL